MVEGLHFLRPYWLWALLPLGGLLWTLWRDPDPDNPWRRVLAPHLHALLLGQSGPAGARGGRGWLALLGAGWLLAVLALANPAWEQRPLPVYQSQAARVIVLDLSRSMTSADLAPDRLTRARFKVEDILRLAGEGQTALVVFAGDAFSVTPLTRDLNTLSAQLRVLTPDILPVQGSRVDLGLHRAGELLQQAGLREGEVLLLADGVEGDQAEVTAAALRQAGYRVSVLGVGTLAGAPLTDDAGRALRDGTGKVIVPRLEEAALRAVAAAGGGVYVRSGGDDRDVAALLAAADAGAQTAARAEETAAAPQWEERGPWLVLLLLPLAALAFRRGWLFGLAWVAVGLAPAPPAAAGEAPGVAWSDLWQRPEQQAARALRDGDYERAAALAADPGRRGAARYRQGDYAGAVADFERGSGADASYNRGNALAQLGRYQEAIAAYDQALQTQPGMADALANKAAVEALLEQQQAQQEQQQNGGQEAPQDQPSEPSGEEDGAAQGRSGGEPQASPGQQAGKDGAEPGEAAPGQSGGPERDPDTPPEPGASGPELQAGAVPDNQFRDALEALDAGAAEPPAAAGAEGAAPDQQPGTATPADRRAGAAEALDNEERQAAEQWLRRIPDDPGGLLRRKFQLQYQGRQGAAGVGGRQGW